jgi:hypothetical protein
VSTKYFELLADEVWEGNPATISSVRHLGDRERNALEATILNKYGKSLSLRGTPAQVHATLDAAKRS